VDRQLQRRLRAARGAAASLTTVLLAGTAHTLAGAGAPSPLLIAVAAVLTAPLAVVLVGRRPSALRTSTAVAAAQVAFHVLFALFADPTAVSYTPADGVVGHAAAHAAPAMTLLHASGGGHDMRPGSPMVLAHLVAAVTTVVLLHRGERVLRALARGIRRLLPRIAVIAPRPTVPRRMSPVAAPTPPRSAALASVLSRRGPPVSV
jgi:hypothetical protein